MDDDLNRLLVNPLPPGVRLHAIIDACHSGSVLDLEYRAEFRSSAPVWTNEYSRRPSVYKARALAPEPSPPSAKLPLKEKIKYDLAAESTLADCMALWRPAPA